jgi:TolA-binding protein
MLVLSLGLLWTVAGQAADPESSEAAKESFSAAVGMQREKQFGNAIEEYRDFLKKFPQDPLAAKARHYLSVCLIEEKRNPDAIVTLTELVEKHPEFQWLDEALLNLGNAQYNVALADKKGAGFAAAAETYGKLLKKFPDSRFGAIAAYSQGECHFAQGNKEAAVTAYALSLEKLPKKQRAEKKPNDPPDLRPDVLYALGATQLDLNQSGPASTTFATFLTDYPDHPLATRIVMLQGDALYQQNKFAEAAKMFARAAADEKFAEGDRATMRQGDCLTAEKKFAEAAAVFATVASKFPKSPSAKKVPLLAGNRYFLASDWGNAVKWCRQVVDAGGPDALQAGHWLARAHLQLKQPAEALAVVEKLLPQAEGSELKVDLALDKADALYDTPARRSESVPLFAAIAKDHPKAPQAKQALFNAAWAALNIEKYDEALQHAQAFSAAYPKGPLATSARTIEADSLLHLNKSTEAAALYRELIESNPKHAERDAWHVLLAWALRRQQKHAEVITLLEPVVGKLKGERRAEAYYLLGAGRFTQKEFAKAAEDLAASLAADGKWTQADEVALLLARCQQQLGKVQDAEAGLRRLIKDDPKSPALDRAHLCLGEILSARKDYPAAATEFELVLKNWPQSGAVPQALYALGWTQLLRQQYGPASETFTTLIDKHAKNDLVPLAQFARAQALRASGKHAEAITDLTAFLASKPSREDTSGALLERGLAELDLGRHADAAKTLDQLLTDDPKYKGLDKVLYNLGWAQRGLKRDSDAAATFTRMVKEYPDSPLLAGALLQVGEHQSSQKKYEDATMSYAAALTRARVDNQTELLELAAHKLAWSQYNLGEHEKARTQFAAQRKEFPRGSLAVDAAFMEAECLLKLGKMEAASAAYQGVLANPPKSPTNHVLAMLHAAQVASQLKQWDEALELLTDATAKFPDAPCKVELLYQLGWVRQNKKELDEATKIYEQVVLFRDSELSARARMMLGELKFEKGDHAGAVRDFFKVYRGYPNAPASYNRWKAQSAFEAGRCNEILKLPADALKCYQEVIEKYPQSDVAPMARKRLAELKASS